MTQDKAIITLFMHRGTPLWVPCCGWTGKCATSGEKAGTGACPYGKYGGDVIIRG